MYFHFFITILLASHANYKNGNKGFDYKNMGTTIATDIKTTAIILPKEEWNKSWTHPPYNEVFGTDISLDSKNNIYTTGQFGYSLNSNITINKTNNMGEPLWNKIIDSGYADGGRGIVCDNLNNVYITGVINGKPPSDFNVFVVKYNESGKLEWFETWGGSGYDEGQDITIDSEGNVYVVGYTTSYGVQSSAILILKYNNTGDFKWNETWDTANYDSGSDIDFDKLSNNLYVVGSQYISSTNDQNALLIKYNTTFDKKWEKIWGDGLNATGNAVKVDFSGNAYITGRIYNFILDLEDVFLVKYNSSGNQLWNLTWNMWLADFRGKDIDIDSLNNIYIVGYRDVFGGDLWLGIHSSSGTKLYNMTWGTIANDEVGNGIVLDSYNFIYITGESYFGFNEANQFILKLSPYYLSIPIPPGNNDNDDDSDDDDDDGRSNLAIPGYNIYITMVLLPIITAVLIKKNFRRFN